MNKPKYKLAGRVWAVINRYPNKECSDISIYMFEGEIEDYRPKNCFPPYFIQPLPCGSIHQASENQLFKTKNEAIDAFIIALEKLRS